MAQQLHHQPGRVAAGARAQRQGLFGRLHTGFHADQVADVLVHHLVHRHQKVNAAALAQVDARQAGLEALARRLDRQVGRQFLSQQGLVLKRIVLGTRLQKEIERVVDRHLHHQADRDPKLGGRFGEHQPCLVIGKRVLLPVHEVPGRLDLERVRNDFAAAMRRRSQPDHLWPQMDRPVVAVMGGVGQRGVDRHRGSRSSRWGQGRPPLENSQSNLGANEGTCGPRLH